MQYNLTLRNLTAHSLTLTLIECYPAHSTEKSASRIFSGLFHNATNTEQPSISQLGQNAVRFQQKETDIHVTPFTTCMIDVGMKAEGPNGAVRLTFQDDTGFRWRIEVHANESRSQRLTPLDPNPPHQYTSIYLPLLSLLAIFDTPDLQSWMRSIADSTPLSALSIPGTHNTPTCFKALPSVRCQAVPPKEQLENGIRFFDIRLQPSGSITNSELLLVHGAFPTSLVGWKRFRTLLDDVYDFLDQNPSETIVMSLKREGTGNATDKQLAAILAEHYTDSQRWYTEPRIPFLGEARGKIVLLRRFVIPDDLLSLNNGRGWGLNAENWAYNTPNCHHEDVHVQDFCEVLEPDIIDHKIQLCCDHFERSAAAVTPVPGLTTDSVHPVPPGPLFLNFLTGSNFWRKACWPKKIAARLNPAMTAFLCEKHDVDHEDVDTAEIRVRGDGGAGIVVCDWVGENGDWDLVRCIVGMNSKMQWRERRSKS